MHTETFAIPSKFRGPPNSGNGGYVCGRIAQHLRGPVSVRLKAPPPLDTALRLDTDATSARLFHGDALIGQARAAEVELLAKPATPYAIAESASAGFMGFKAHSFPGCFVCGTARASGDGLRIFPGHVADTEVIASPWNPDPSLIGPDGLVANEFIWSALDCPSAFAVLPLPSGIAIVLGELSASIVSNIKASERCVVTAWALGAQGRKRFAGSAVHTERGDLVAVARATWIEVSAEVWGAS